MVIKEGLWTILAVDVSALEDGVCLNRVEQEKLRYEIKCK